MSISLLLEMAQGSTLAISGEAALVSGETRWKLDELNVLSDGGAGVIAASGARHVVYVGTGGVMLSLLLFASARAAIPVAPLNYRLAADGLQTLIGRLPDPLVIVDEDYRDAVGQAGFARIGSAEFLDAAATADPVTELADPDTVAVVLFTSGTTSAPKAVEITHSNLTSYIMGTVEFDSAATGDTALVCVPPYHIAGVSAALSNLYAGRRLVYLTAFSAAEWVRLIDAEAVTSATVVPTMLDRIVTALENIDTTLPTLRTLAYGGSKVPLPLVRKALEQLPGVGFVNAYGLTETSSTIAVLGPEDHRAALAATDESAIRRLGSVGQPVPGIEVEIRAEDGTVVGPGETGELFVRGEQVSGKYTDIGSVLDENGWFPTKDVAHLDEEGYLFIGGRSDDTIIRGGENIAPAEIEGVLVEHPHVHDCAVVGADDPEWGQKIVAVVVPRPGTDPDIEELRGFVRSRLRGSRTPDQIMFRDELPTNATGKVLRRELVTELNVVKGVRMIKNGTRLQSQVCDTQVIVVRSSDALDDLQIGGAPAISLDATPDPELTLDDTLSGGSLMGKRYVDDGGAEVLVTKAGKGTISVGSTPLTLKEAKPLPASD
ncbi:fatty acid--CoA ligase family protein [Mycobacterium sp. 236(2023)]|uniref:class I adenylate-forming enzyme family protein n=1 Tax=Mycobacterium sp. 236(2023) TaxID=3038163 RepID=UPI00241550EB|nr:fatty acid--CoA ligase family protein [Mycobacterium sp. 236(2023)]MDG4669176.1 fatty acid--CoA ligase family protein [Mycobacterium sp. 236(2023)]